jgi:enoyl-CoA hydratase
MMSAFETIIVERLDGAVGLVRLNRPKALNALSSALMRELIAALTEMDADDAVRCMVITGSDSVFAAGADITEMATATAIEMFSRDTISLWDRLGALTKPIIAAVSGYCLGGGLELALACDMIVASETARFGQPEITIGVIPGAGGTQRLTRAVGKALAMEMILNNRALVAAEAAHFGLVNHVYPVAAYLEETLTLARAVASQAPVAVRLAKETINKAFDLSLAEGLAYERRTFYFLFTTVDQKEGMAAFLGKRSPQWTGK